MVEWNEHAIPLLDTERDSDEIELRPLSNTSAGSDIQDEFEIESDNQDESNDRQRNGSNGSKALQSDVPSTAEVAELADLEGQPVLEEPRPYWHVLFSRGVQLFLVAMLFSTLMRAASKYVVQSVHPLIAVQTRMCITAAIAVTSMYVKKVKHNFWGAPEIRKLLWLRGCLGFFNIAVMFYALQFMSLPDLAIIGFLGPIVTGVLSRILLHESYVWQQALCGVVSLGGVIIIAKPPWLFGSTEEKQAADPMTPLRSLAIIGALLVVLSASLTMIVIRKIGNRAHALASAGIHGVCSIIGSSILIVLSVLFLGMKVEYPTDPYIWFLLGLTGLFGFCLQFLSSKALQLEQASILSSFRPTQLIWSIIAEAIIWGDFPDWWSFIGGVIILVAVSYSATFKKDKPVKA